MKSGYTLTKYYQHLYIFLLYGIKTISHLQYLISTCQLSSFPLNSIEVIITTQDTLTTSAKVETFPQNISPNAKVRTID